MNIDLTKQKVTTIQDKRLRGETLQKIIRSVETENNPEIFKELMIRSTELYFDGLVEEIIK